MQDRAALNGVEQLLETILTIQRQTPNDAVRLRAIVRNRVSEGAIACRRNAVKLEALEEQGVPVAATLLKEARAWHNAGAGALRLVLHAPNSGAARDVREPDGRVVERRALSLYERCRRRAAQLA